eukprot:CAMPEP_0115883162 /NCGR_PEP_ID=MMETSP0287-20121206/29419_1 /TAXON_ID=412157 /ORGANISM="Chrysochromulina rotalis, Strain UIO044" /LENGTH=48 /DNA_ID= /DNA_START= /DNA_END= /DNA_ORIENTATION=
MAPGEQDPMKCTRGWESSQTTGRLMAGRREDSSLEDGGKGGKTQFARG